MSSSARVVRHRLPDRLYHWTMAAAVFTLLGTAFLPIAGWQFEWVTPHWIAGLALTATVVFHIVRSIVWLDWRLMVVDATDVRSAGQVVRQSTGDGSPGPVRTGKYSLLQKLFHLVVAIEVLALIVTGLLMLAKIDTPLWRRNPYFLSDRDWGVVYTVHDIAAMTTITLVIMHVYFALRPEKWWMTRSMFRGWISVTEYRTHHDPARWPAAGENGQ